jgi:hypothetical protein
MGRQATCAGSRSTGANKVQLIQMKEKRRAESQTTRRTRNETKLRLLSSIVEVKRHYPLGSLHSPYCERAYQDDPNDKVGVI